MWCMRITLNYRNVYDGAHDWQDLHSTWISQLLMTKQCCAEYSFLWMRWALNPSQQIRKALKSLSAGLMRFQSIPGWDYPSTSKRFPHKSMSWKVDLGGDCWHIYIYTYASTPQHHDPDFWVVPVRISAVDSFYGLQNGNGNGLGTRRLSMLQTLKEFLAEPNFRKESLPKPDSLKESLP